MLTGTHCSVSGGLQNAFSEAERLNIDTFQIFTRNQRQWKAKPVTEEEAGLFKSVWNKSQVKIIFSHCSYLINLAAGDPLIEQKSIDALQAEVERCTKLGLSWCILHPGAGGTQERTTAMRKVHDNLLKVIEASPESKVKVLLEITAGQGTSLGGKIEDLATITEGFPYPDRIGYCVDTCHAFAAGYDIRTQTGMEDFLGQFDKQLGVNRIEAFHLNDSKGDLGTHLDRHAHIGEGKLGLEPFRYIMNTFSDKPKVLETPKEDDMDRVNIDVLLNLV